MSGHQKFSAEPHAFVSLADVFGRESDLVFIDGGAHVGRVSAQLLQVFPNATVHAFEPVGDTFRHLETNLSGQTRAHCWNYALGSREESLEIRVNGCTGTSSLLDSERRLVRYHGSKAQTKRIEHTSVVKLDDWALKFGVDQVDVIKLDLQGYELEALRGGGRLLGSTVRAIYSEAQLVPLYHGAALFSDIDVFLRSQGFELFRIQELFFNGAEQRSTCCDAIWLRHDVMDSYCQRIAERAA